MNSRLLIETKHRHFGGRAAVFIALVVMSAISAAMVFLLLDTHADQLALLPRDTLWQVVHNLCVPNESEHHDPAPCVEVNLVGGVEKGFALVRDPRGGIQFLLVPLIQIPGIESPIVRAPGAPNYFAGAWAVREHIDEALHQTLPRDYIALAVNSAPGRTQDQLHIHFSCVQPEVWKALHKDERKIGDHWAPLKPSLFGHDYQAMWAPGESLDSINPFRLLAESLSDADRNMSNRALAVVGMTRADGSKGFVILAGRVDRATNDLANAEELLDHSCEIARMKTGHGAD
jgi:CDP-diacylglycerol pyrophosphatase